MNNKLLSVMAGLGIILIATSYATINQASAQYTGSQYANDNQKTISVMGSATTSVKPDKVILSFAVETRNNTAAMALDQNTAIMNNVLAALEAAGVQQSDINTANFNIMPMYKNAPNTFGPGNLTGYAVTNTVQVSSSKLTSVSGWIDVAVKAGANRVDNISFTMSDDSMKSARSSLITQAIADAKSKADLAASAVGMKVIGVKSMGINENFFRPPFMGPVGIHMGGELVAMNQGTPVIAGEQQATVNVNITYLVG